MFYKYSSFIYLSLLMSSVFQFFSCQYVGDQKNCESLVNIESYVEELDTYNEIKVHLSDSKLLLKKSESNEFYYCCQENNEKKQLINDLILGGLFEVSFGDKNGMYSFILGKEDNVDLKIIDKNDLPETTMETEELKSHMKDFDSLIKVIDEKSTSD